MTHAMTPLQSDLLDIAQRDFPLSPRPYAELALRLGVREDDVIEAFKAMRDARLLSRIGAVYRPGSAGASTLAAIAVPPKDLDTVAAIVTAFPEVNHNYERENAVNLWFVVTAPDETARDAVLDAIEDDTGLAVLRLPMVEDYHLDLGFLLSRS